MSDKIIGIDLGTTNSVLSITRDGVPVLVPVAGEPLLPSVVGVTPGGERLVGTPARNQWTALPERTVRSIKRKMGSDEPVEMAGETYMPQEIAAFVLKAIKEAAEAEAGAPVTRAVITVPAYFDEVQRQATVEAGQIAGLEVARIINEPTAAALAYGYGQSAEEDLRVLVYDLGGGTFDVSIIDLNAGIIDVRATEGNNHLGGDDFDERLAQTLAGRFEEEHGIDLTRQHRAWVRLLRAAEEAKIALSSAPLAEVALEYIAESGDGTPLHLRETVERSEFEDVIEDLVEQTIEHIGAALEAAELEVADIDRVLLVGGSTRIPLVQMSVTEALGQEPHAEVDPDAAVALGAAVQGGIIAGEEIDAILVDVTPLSLGIETAQRSLMGYLVGDRFTPLVRRNTTIPVQKSELFTTVSPGQEVIDLKVYQGDDPVASHNTLLGEFSVENLKPKADGYAEVLVHFSLDINGLLDVTVTDRKSGKQTREQLKADRQRLSPEAIARSYRRLFDWDPDAPDEADEETSGDATGEVDLAALDPGVQALVNRARKLLGEGDLKPEQTAAITEAVEAILEAAHDDPDALEARTDALIDLLMDVGD
jgi:molecular chaperone DnaK